MCDHQEQLTTLCSVILSACPSQVRAARDFVTEALLQHPRLADAQLLTSELATNSINHTPSPVNRLVARVKTGKRTIRIEITVDTHEPPQVPSPRRAELDAESGRGLHLIDQIADAWGYTRNSRTGTFTTWFELA